MAHTNKEDRVSGYNYSDDDELENEVSSNSGGGLRKLLEETLEENKKLRKAIQGDSREKTTTALLKENGLDPAIAELIPDDYDPKQWVEKYAHLLGVPQNEVAPDADEEAAPSELQLADDSDPALVLEREARAAMSDAQESGSPSHVDNDLLERMDKIDSEDELIKFFNANGGTRD